jgi:predicted regulator of Ras-like GTPase activity (Roadblock/LC7/MglB family)
MDAANALADLTEISSQVEAAVVLGKDGKVAASTLADGARAESIANVARDLLAAGDDLGSGGRTLVQLEVALREGSVFVVRENGGTIAATTTPSPTSGLVFYDLRACLRALAEKPAPKPRRRAPAKKKAPADA